VNVRAPLREQTHRWFKTRFAEEYLAQLATLPLFSACSRRELEFVSRWAERTTLPAGTTMVRAGRDCREFFVLLEGEVILECAGAVAELAGAGAYFGHVALMARAPSDVTVLARGCVQVLILEQRNFEAMRRRCPTVEHKLAAQIATRLWTELGLHAGASSVATSQADPTGRRFLDGGST
jgi:CRP-like cAMP-binding protein